MSINHGQGKAEKNSSLILRPLMLLLFAAVLFSSCSSSKVPQADTDGWINLFDGKSLNGWKASDDQTTFKVEDGVIKGQGTKSHLYYVGPILNHDFKNFEFQVQVKTDPGTNSGVYFHTKFQEKGWPDDGFEVQVNNTAGDWKKTGSLYDILDFGDNYVKDNEWFTMYIKVVDKDVLVKLNGKTVLGWSQPDGFTTTDAHPGRIISSGTFCFQQHDPNSTVYYKDVKVRPLP